MLSIWKRILNIRKLSIRWKNKLLELYSLSWGTLYFERCSTRNSASTSDKFHISDYSNIPFVLRRFFYIINMLFVDFGLYDFKGHNTIYIFKLIRRVENLLAFLLGTSKKYWIPREQNRMAEVDMYMPLKEKF